MYRRRTVGYTTNVTIQRGKPRKRIIHATPPCSLSGRTDGVAVGESGGDGIGGGGGFDVPCVCVGDVFDTGEAAEVTEGDAVGVPADCSDAGHDGEMCCACVDCRDEGFGLSAGLG